MDGSGVVDEDVYAAVTFVDLGEEVFGAGGGGEVGAEGGGLGADRGGGFESGAAVAVTGYVCSGLGEGEGDSGAKASGGAGDECDFAVEAEGIEDGWHGTFNVSQERRAMLR